MGKHNDLANILTKFDEIMKNTADDKNTLALLMNYLRAFLRTKDPTHTLPASEIMAIIKQEKPNVFYFLKQQGINNPSLDLLTQLEMDYEVALQRLENLKKQL